LGTNQAESTTSFLDEVSATHNSNSDLIGSKSTPVRGKYRDVILPMLLITSWTLYQTHKARSIRRLQ
jgi:hypothetical protein